MAALDTRLRWVVSRLADVLGVDVVGLEAQLMGSTILEVLETFMRGDGPRHLSFALPSSPTPKLTLLTNASVSEDTKCVYFIRLTNRDITADTVDRDIAFGSIEGGALKATLLLLEEVYSPLLLDMKTWGQASGQEQTEFAASVVKCIDKLHDAVSGLETVIELAKPDHQYEIEPKQIAITRAAQDEALVHHYEEVVDTWTAQIEPVLAEIEQVRSISDDEGPSTELDYWKRRFAKFNSISEQLKGKEMKVVQLVLSAAARNKAIKKLKALDNNVTDATTEAKDNVKFLTSLEKYTQPMYTASPKEIGEVLPGLFNTLKMMHSVSVARFYGSAERMTALLCKVSNQIVKNCKHYAAAEHGIWEDRPQEAVRRMSDCITLLEIYQDQFRQLRDKALQASKGRPFELNELVILASTMPCAGAWPSCPTSCRSLFSMMRWLSATLTAWSRLWRHFTSRWLNCAVAGMIRWMRRTRSSTKVCASVYHPLSSLSLSLSVSLSLFSSLLPPSLSAFCFCLSFVSVFDNSVLIVSHADYSDLIRSVQEQDVAVHSLLNKSFEVALTTEQALALYTKFATILKRESIRVRISCCSLFALQFIVIILPTPCLSNALSLMAGDYRLSSTTRCSRSLTSLPSKSRTFSNSMSE